MRARAEPPTATKQHMHGATRADKANPYLYMVGERPCAGNDTHNGWANIMTQAKALLRIAARGLARNTCQGETTTDAPKSAQGRNTSNM